MTLISRRFPDRPGRFGWEIGCRRMERFQSEAFSGTAEGAEWPEPISQRKRRATAPSSSRNERTRSKVVARAPGCDHGAERALVPVRVPIQNRLLVDVQVMT